MLKNLFIVTVFFLTQTLLFSQQLSKDFTLSVGKPYKVIDAGSKEYVSLDNGFVIFAKMGRGIVNIQKYDINKMEEVARNTYDDLPAKARFQDIVKLGDRIFYIYEAYNRSDKNFKVYTREIDTENATFKEQKVIIETSRKVVNSPRTGELTRIRGGFTTFSIPTNKFLVYKSYGGSKVMITYRAYPSVKNDSKNYDDIGFYVFDNEMKKIWGKEVKMPYTEKEINNIGYAVTSSGEARMLITNKKEKRYELLMIDNTGKLKTKDLGISSDYFIRHTKMKENANGNIVCGGFYANGIEFSYNPFTGGQFIFNANGLLVFVIDNDGNVISQNTYEFPEKFIQQNLSDRQKKAVAKREEDGKAGILDLILTNLVMKEDGSAIFIGERQWAKREYYHGPQKKYVYHFSNIIVLKVNKDGKLEWMKKLPKNQDGTNGCGQMSFAYMEGDGHDYYAYVDNPKNINLSPEDGVPSPHADGKGGFLTTYKVDYNTGDMEKHTICELDDIKGYKAYQFNTWRITKVGEGVFIMEMYIKGKKDNLVKFELTR